jgi:hypothetical protein
LGEDEEPYGFGYGSSPVLPPLLINGLSHLLPHHAAQQSYTEVNALPFVLLDPLELLGERT